MPLMVQGEGGEGKDSNFNKTYRWADGGLGKKEKVVGDMDGNLKVVAAVSIEMLVRGLAITRNPGLKNPTRIGSAIYGGINDKGVK